MKDIIKNIFATRKLNRNNILIVHICVVATIAAVFFISESELFVIVRVLCGLYACLCFYLLIFKSDKLYYLFWPIFLHTIFFISIEVEEKGLNFFLLIYLLTILMSFLVAIKNGTNLKVKT